MVFNELPRFFDGRGSTAVGADLVVMGAYSHSRLRERIFGGATQSMLEKTKLPIFWGH